MTLTLVDLTHSSPNYLFYNNLDMIRIVITEHKWSAWHRRQQFRFCVTGECLKVDKLRMFPNNLCFAVVLLAFASLGCVESASNNKISSRIIDGEAAVKNQFNYYAQMIALQVQYPYEYEVLCGGSLISRFFVLTAAHCVIGDREITIRLGSINSNDTTNEERRWVDEAWWHSGFNFDTLHHDIALMKMNEPVEYSVSIMPIKLYCYNGDTPADTLVQVAGEGLVNETTNQLPNTLQYGDFRTISNKDCAKSYPIITPENICAVGVTDQATCSGDSGSGMVQNTLDVRFHIAIVSYGSASGCQKAPGAFTRTSNYTAWIKNIMSEHNDDEEICANSPPMM